MFPSQQLISYVFANPDDEYRCNDLLKLNLKQYLWKSLHQQYHTVYFLDSRDACTFTVHTFGDRDAVLPGTPKWKQTHQAVFGNWLLSRLCQDHRNAAAIVCPLDVFCRVLSHEEWRHLLEELAGLSWPRRTGILVLTASPYAEDSWEYLMHSPVFDRLRETAVTTSRGRNRCIYSDLREKKPAHYQCLSTFTPERIDDLLLHICAGNPDKCLAPPERKELARRLAAHLQHGQPLPGVPTTATPVLYLTYRELYGQLQSPQVWAGVQELSHRLRPTQTRPILRRRDGYAGRCLTLQLPPWVQGQRDSGNRYPEDTLDEIHRTVSTPSNRPENRDLLEKTWEFMGRLNDLMDDDIDTCSLLLDALRFCTDRITVCDEDANCQVILNASEKYLQCADQSVSIFRRTRELVKLKNDPFATANTEHWAEQWTNLEQDRSTLLRCAGFLRTNTVLLENSSSSDLRNLYYEQIRTYEFLRSKA